VKAFLKQRGKGLSSDSFDEDKYRGNNLKAVEAVGGGWPGNEGGGGDLGLPLFLREQVFLSQGAADGTQGGGLWKSVHGVSQIRLGKTRRVALQKILFP